MFGRVLALSVALTLAVSGCVAVGPAAGTFRSADLLPADTWLYSAFTTRVPASQAAAFLAVQSAFTSQPDWNDAVTAVLAGAPTPNATATGTEALGLLSGEVAVGVSGPPSGSMRFVSVVESTNADRILSLASGGGRGTSTHNGVQVQQLSSTQFAAASKGWAVFASDLASVEGVLDRLDRPGQPSLAQQPRFRAAVGRLPADKVGLTYTDVAPLLRDPLVGAAAGRPLGPGLDVGELLPSSAASYAFAPDGIEVRIEASGPLAGAETLAAVSPPEDALAGFSRLPASSLLAVGGALPPEYVELTGLLAETGLDRLRDTFPNAAELELHPETWLTGQFAFGLGRGTLAASLLRMTGSPAVFGAIGVSDPVAAGRDLRQLEQLLPPKSIDLVSVAGQRLQQVTLGQSNQVLTYGVSDGWLYAIGGGGDPAEVVGATDEGGLTDGNARFGVVRRVLRDDGVNLFVDLEASRAVLEDQIGLRDLPPYQREARPFVAPLRALGASYWLDPDGLSHGQVLLVVS